MISAILFDLDDTLVDRNASMRWALAEQYDYYKNDLIDISKENYIEKLIEYQEHGYVNTKMAYDRLFRTENVKVTVIQQLNNDINLRYGTKTILFDNVIETLEALKDKYRMAVITNGRIDWQYRKLRQAKMEKYFVNITISEEVGFEKPNQNIFMTCLKKMEIRPENCIFVGDNPEIDIKPAIEMGMKAIWKDNGYFEKPAKLNGRIKNFNELINEIEKIENEEI